MVGFQQQVGGVVERRVVREPTRLGMTMRADNRKLLDPLVQPSGNVPRVGVRREQAIGMEGQAAHSS